MQIGARPDPPLTNAPETGSVQVIKMFAPVEDPAAFKTAVGLSQSSIDGAKIAAVGAFTSFRILTGMAAVQPFTRFFTVNKYCPGLSMIGESEVWPETRLPVVVVHKYEKSLPADYGDNRGRGAVHVRP